MAVESTMLALGTPAPDFDLPDPAGERHRRDDCADAPALVVAFICNHCPYVKHIRRELALLARALQQQGVAIVGINSNDPEAYPDDAPTAMADEIRQVGYTFPYLIDDSQDVAKAYRAACTPDFYVFDGGRALVYRGQFDASRPGNREPVTGADLRAAVEAALGDVAVEGAQRPSMGCGIKWKPGNAPSYA